MFARTRTPSSWPFWLLILAWACANIPATVQLYAIVWVKQAEHFSHHDTLKANVAALLAGKSRENPVVTAVNEAAERTHAPLKTISVEIKKSVFELIVEVIAFSAVALLAERMISRMRLPDSPALEVPFPPPRAAFASISLR